MKSRLLMPSPRITFNRSMVKRRGSPEPALVLGIIRQETEFDPHCRQPCRRARHHADHAVRPRGAMRRLAGLPYRPNDLTSDLNYNMQLGMTEFSGYLGDWTIR